MTIVRNILQVQVYTHNRKEEHERLINLFKQDNGCVLVYAKPNEYWSRGDHPEYTWIIEAYYDRTKITQSEYRRLIKEFKPTKIFEGVINEP